MKLETVAHAVMTLTADDGDLVLLTDPWLVGSCYWRSWWLENAPSDRRIAELGRARFAYISHEHSDHFHPPSLGRLGRHPTYLTPSFPVDRLGSYFREHGYRTAMLPPLRWWRLHPEIAVLSVPAIGNDSFLVVDTPRALILDMNDARPSPLQLLRLRGFLDRHARGKTRYLLSSYSSAGIANSFSRGGRSVTAFDKRAHVGYVSWLCRFLRADVFLPFASQVVYARHDTAWANAHRVRFPDLQSLWTAPGTRLVPPHSTMDLASQSVQTVPPEEYRFEAAAVETKVAAQEAGELGARFGPEDAARLEAKLRGAGGMLLALLFPRGLAFEAGNDAYTYDPWRRRLGRGLTGSSASLRIPARPLADVLRQDNFADICIPMFTRVDLDRITDPRVLYLFFLVIALHDAGVTRGLAPFLSWAADTVRMHAAPIPPPASARPIEELSE